MRQNGQYDGALGILTRALRLAPYNREALGEMVLLGSLMDRVDVQLKGLVGFYEQGQLSIEHYPSLCDLLFRAGRIEEALKFADTCLSRLPQMKTRGKRNINTLLTQIQAVCRSRLEEKTDPGPDAAGQPVAR